MTSPLGRSGEKNVKRASSRLRANDLPTNALPEGECDLVGQGVWAAGCKSKPRMAATPAWQTRLAGRTRQRQHTKQTKAVESCTDQVIFHASHSDFLKTRTTMSLLPVGGTPHTQATPASAGRRATSARGGRGGV